VTDQQVWAVTMVRDEADVIGGTIRHLINEGVDGIIVANNGSTDQTWGEAAAAAHGSGVQLRMVEDPEVAYYQSRKMTALASWAHDEGATWIVPFDADELWYARGEDRLADYLRSLPPKVGVVRAELYNHFATSIDVPDPSPFRSLVYRQREPGALPKVAVRWCPELVIHQGNHSATHPAMSQPGGAIDSAVELRHFPFRSFEQFVRKARNGAEAYKATDLDPSVGAHWRQYGEILERHGEDALREVWERWYHFLSPTDGGLVYDPAPFMRWGA
jgi:hypothetical protein